MKKANEAEKNSICSSCRCTMYINVEKLSRTFYYLSYEALHLIVTVCKGGSGTNRPEMFHPDLGFQWHDRPRHEYVSIIQIKPTTLSFLRSKILQCFYVLYIQFKATLQRGFLAFIVLKIIISILTLKHKNLPPLILTNNLRGPFSNKETRLCCLCLHLPTRQSCMFGKWFVLRS